MPTFLQLLPSFPRPWLPSLLISTPPISSLAPLSALSVTPARKSWGSYCCRWKAMADLTDVPGQGGGAPGESEALWVEPESTSVGRRLEPAGWEHFINKSSKWLMALLLGGTIVWMHNAQVLWVATGAILNTWSSIGLKLILNQERPTPSLRSSPGMPSSHAQSLFFGVFFLITLVLQWLGINAFSITIGTLIFMTGSYLSWLRVSQQLHTISQVIVGATLGMIISAGWLYMWHAIVLDAYTSYVWVRIAVITAFLCFCSAFFLYITRYWIPRDSSVIHN